MNAAAKNGFDRNSSYGKCEGFCGSFCGLFVTFLL